MPGPAGGEGGNEVGRVSVRVVPDATGFRRDLEEQLKAQNADEPREVDVKANLVGVQQAEAKLDSVARDRSAEIEVVTTDVDRWQRRIAASINKVMSDADTRLEPTLDDENLRQGFQKLERDFKGLLNAFNPAVAPEILAKDRAFLEAQLAEIKKEVNPIVGRLEFKELDWRRQSKFLERTRKLQEQIAAEQAKFLEGQSFDIKLNPEFDFRLAKKLRNFEPEPIKVALDPQFDYRFNKKLRAFEPEPIKIGLDPTADFRLRQRLNQLQAKMTVKPDLENFQKDAISKVQKAFEAVEANIGLSIEEEEFRAALLKAKAEAEAILTAEIPVEPIGALSARAKIMAIVKTWEAGAKAQIPVEPEMDLFQQRLLAEVKAVERYVEAKIPATPEGEAFRAKLIAMVKAAEAGIKIEIPVGIEEGSLARSGMLASLKNLKDAFGVNIEDLSGLGKEFANVGFSAGRAAGGLISIAIAGGAVLAVLALLSPAIAILSGLLLTIPAALTGLVVPIGVIALGLDGIKEAATEAGLFSDSNGDKKGGGEVGAALDALKEKVNSTFKEGLKPAFMQIADLVKMPGIATSISSVAKGLSDIFAGVTSSLTQGDGPAQIQNIISNIGKAFSDATPGVKNFTTGILELVSAMSDKFPGISEAFNRTGESFLGWVRDFIDSGDLDRFTTNLGDTLSSIGNVFSTLFNDGIDNMSSDGYVDKIQEFVDAINELLTVTLPGLAESFMTIADAMDPIVDAFDFATSAAENFRDVLDMIPSLGGNPLESGIKGLGPLDFLPKFGTGAPGLGSLIDLGIDWLAEDPAAEGDARRQGAKLAQLVREGFKETTDAGLQLGMPQLFSEDVGAAVSQQIKDAINVSNEDQEQALRSAFTADGVDSAVSQQLTTKVTQAVESAKEVMAGLAPELQTQIDAALLPLNTLADGIGEKVGLAFETVGSAVDTAFGLIFLKIEGRSGDLKTGISNAFTGIADPIVNALATAVTTAGGKAEELKTAITTPLEGVKTAVTTAFDGFAESATNAVNGAKEGVVTAGGEIEAEVRSWVTRLPAALAGLRDAFFSAGLSAGQGLANGIRQSGALAVAAARQVAADVAAASAGELKINSPSKVFIGIGESVGEGFSDGIANGTAGVVQQVNDMTNAVIAAGQATPDSLKTLQELLSLQSQAADLQSVGASKAEKAELDRIKDFNSLVQARIKMRDTELKSMTKMNDLQVDAWKNTQQLNKEQKKSVGQQAQALKEGFKDSLEPLTQLTPDLLMGGGKSNIYEAGKVDFTTKAELEALKLKEQQIDMQKSLLQLQMKSGDSPELKAQMALLDTQKERLSLQGKELEYWAKYEDTSRDLNDRYEEAGAKLQDMPLDFAKATGQQFMQDLGMSGNGMIPQLLTEGTKYIFNVAGIDDALSAQQRLQNKRTQGVVGR